MKDNKDLPLKSDNEIIAEFMGIPKCTDPAHQDDPCYWGCGDYIKKDQLPYPRSWDALIPVVEKIERLGFHSHILDKKCYFSNANEYFEGRYEASKLKSTYNTVVQFIKWYNSQKQ